LKLVGRRELGERSGGGCEAAGAVVLNEQVAVAGEDEGDVEPGLPISTSFSFPGVEISLFPGWFPAAAAIKASRSSPI
jgi:hypothetical protein